MRMRSAEERDLRARLIVEATEAGFPGEPDDCKGWIVWYRADDDTYLTYGVDGLPWMLNGGDKCGRGKSAAEAVKTATVPCHLRDDEGACSAKVAGRTGERA